MNSDAVQLVEVTPGGDVAWEWHCAPREGEDFKDFALTTATRFRAADLQFLGGAGDDRAK